MTYRVLKNPDSKTLIFFLAGFDGHYKDYMPHFIKLLSVEHNVCISEIKSYGLCKTSDCIEDFVKTLNTVKNKINPKKIFLVGHSMGAMVEIAACKLKKIKVDGFYCINAFPSYADCIHINLPNIDWGPLSFSLKEYKVTEPIMFAIGKRDEVTYTIFKKNRSLFRKYFLKNPHAKIVYFKDMTHNFNHHLYDFAGFNKSHSGILINNIFEFINNYS